MQRIARTFAHSDYYILDVFFINENPTAITIFYDVFFINENLW